MAVSGTRFFGIEDALRRFGTNFTTIQVAVFAVNPFSEAKLQESTDSHILEAVLPISIAKMRSRFDGQFFFRQLCYDTEPFFTEAGKSGWQLINSTPVDGSSGQTFPEQRRIVYENGEEIPSARVVIYTILAYYLATGKWLFEDAYVRTSSIYSPGRHIAVGVFKGYGIYMTGEFGDDERNPIVGVASAHKV